MKQKMVFIISVMIVLLVISIAMFFNWNRLVVKKSLNDLNEIIEQDEIDQLKLSIYFHPLSMSGPYSVEMLADEIGLKWVIWSDELEDNADILYKISKTDLKVVSSVPDGLKPLHIKYLEDVYEYLIFETEERGEFLRIAMGSFKFIDHNRLKGKFIHGKTEYAMMINGVIVEDNEEFSRLLSLFIPDISKKLNWDK